MKPLKETLPYRSLCVVLFSLVVIATQAHAIVTEKEITASRGTLKETVHLEWTPVSWATGYHILRSFNYNGLYFPVGWSEDGDETYRDENVEGGVYYWYKVKPQFGIFSGRATQRVQGWITPREPGGMVDTAERIPGILKQIPHFHNVKSLAETRRASLPEPTTDEANIPSNADIFKWVEGICATEHRRIGSPESQRAIAQLKTWLTDLIGAQGLVYDEAFDLEAVYTASEWGLTVNTGEGDHPFDAFYAVNTGMTLNSPHGSTVSGPMVWAADGSPEAFDALGNIQGKVVVAECEFSSLPLGLIDLLFNGGYAKSDPESWINLLTSIPMTFTRSNFPAEYLDDEHYDDSVYWQAYDRGAAGLVLIMKNHPGDINTHWGPYDGRMKPMPCMWVSSHKEEEIKQLAESNATATITLEGLVEPGQGHNIYAVLPATVPVDGKLSEEIILISSHHDSCFKGATEDGTGVAMVLAQAAYWSRIEKREKNLVFVFTDGHHYRGIGAESFAHTHLNDIMAHTIININLEHMAAKGVKENSDGKLVVQDHGALTTIFINESPTAIATTRRMLEKAMPDRTVAIHSTLLGNVPPGESGHFHVVAGIDFIHWIGYPVYLLTAEDTLDKVDQTILNPLARAAIELTGTFMILPEGYSDYEQ
ncbi:M28 family peptidase [Desulfoluna sp.]|uniref:M28 family peptidase n=1 Tax=Desulfoluna sp. TaxID=2045199 RepID=UPI0026022EDC|nr:M28 family peptidase [Desulfoluna sp.]